MHDYSGNPRCRMKHDARGSWLREGGHQYDPILSGGIATVLSGKGVQTVIDIGCGDGSYIRHLKAFGFDCAGYDGNPLTEQITGGLCHVADFSEPQQLGLYDAVLSLEVGEHIPAEFENVYLANVAAHAEKIIIMSWAVPGQGGYGHVNERENGWVVI